jgi:mannose-6-phosphate isomerase
MTIERARSHAISKPWGVVELRPWSNAGQDGSTIGEIWYERPGTGLGAPSLLLKLLFTSQPLSIQVHPDDSFAHAMGLQNGKTEAWYVLRAAPEAKVALGLSRRLTPLEFRGSIASGSIADLVRWQTVQVDDVIFVPAGTIHAIGAGLVIAELQQRSDVTFRLFDHGRQRELHIENAIMVADAGPAGVRVKPSRLTDERTLLVSNPHFVFERIDLAPESAWRLDTEYETWILILDGSVRAGPFDIAIGDAVFAQSDRVDIRVGTVGVVALVAYKATSPLADLLQPVIPVATIDASRDQALPTFEHQDVVQ